MSQNNGAESDGRLVAAKTPFKLPWNRLKLSPTCSGFPVFVTVSVPPRVSVAAVIESAFVGEPARSSFRKVVSASAKLLEKISAPIEVEVPGEIIPLAVTFPATFPLPLKVWVASNFHPPETDATLNVALLCKLIVGVLEIEPEAVSSSVPPLIVVAPL